MGLLKAALNKYGVSLEDFIFNDRFIIVIDGDEYGVFDTLIETDMFNKNAVEDIIPERSLVGEDWNNDEESEEE